MTQTASTARSAGILEPKSGGSLVSRSYLHGSTAILARTSNALAMIIPVNPPQA